ncbi:hypothetical protein NC797_16615 [Aquibacillus sp. 3ASR75-11]|uniref:Uncharacterized protein n=1 Tax=Terrihalobacillus insolitus TaxID=2950438 RepID=A0A9X3WXL5_9BACI|nr:hypothetical protein [Terrihalobacillus insolitus]MDC3414545.1 hypothetical protein [Terrihalobacillus insolitus]MDC3426121.1 hypothetical protein [Terrihalobacillus insolitus]
MLWVILISAITILSVYFGLNKKRPILFTLPFAAIFLFLLVKIMLVPIPFWDTVRFIFDLRG